MRKNVILYGGKFDPIHTGHVQAALLGLDKVANGFGEPSDLWFLPTYSTDHGQIDLEDSHRRLEMLDNVVNTVLKDWPNISVCTYELDKANGAGTYAVVKDLRRLCPDINFKFLIGADQAYTIRQWRNSRKLVKTIPFVIVPRSGTYNMTGASWFHDTPHTFIRRSKSGGDKISSTSIRQAFRASRDVLVANGSHGHLFPHTYKYIMDHNLYNGAKYGEKPSSFKGYFEGYISQG